MAREILVKFTQWLYEAKVTDGFHTGKLAVLAAQTFFPDLRGQLRETWESVESWQQETPVKLRTAVPLPVLLAMVILTRTMTLDAALKQCFMWHAGPVLCKIAFLAMLRSVDVLRPRRKIDLLPQARSGLGGKIRLIQGA